jgi:hypothetical protein
MNNIQKYITSISLDISSNDVETNPIVNEKLSRELPLVVPSGVKSALSNITGDDIVITSFVPENLIEETNKSILSLLKKHAEGFGDLNGISQYPEHASEGVSYAIAKAGSEYGDAIVVSFDTYGGESLVNEMALFVEDIGQNYGYDVDSSVSNKPKKIHGVGYSGVASDDPVVVITFEELDELPQLAGLIFGGLLKFDKLSFVKKGSAINIVPPGVIYTMSAFLNGNVVDLYHGLKQKCRFL